MKSMKIRSNLQVKSSSISDLLHTTPEEFENADLFLRLGLPSVLIRHENEAFRKRSLNRRNLETPALRFSWDGKHFDSDAFRKRRKR